MFTVEFKKSAKKELDDCPIEYKEKIISSAKFLMNQSDRRDPTASRWGMPHSVTTSQIVIAASSGVSNPQFVNESYPFKFYDVRKVKGRENVYGIRVGKYRFLYEVFKEEHFILIFRVEIKSETTYK